jgi:hypothetical protein
MTRGVLMFAFNNAHIDYIKLAKFSAYKVKQHLKVPVTLVTDNDQDDLSMFDNVIVTKKNTSQQRFFNDGVTNSFVDTWNNVSRFTCYNITPYDETLVIDCDYIINSDFLNCCWGKSSDFLIFKDSFDLANWRNPKDFKQISEYSIDFYWATVFYFRKSEKNEIFFNLIEHIRDNWSFYMMMYQTLSPHFRNDLAYSIAIHMLNGFSHTNIIETFPSKISYILDSDLILDFQNNDMQFLVAHPTTADEYMLVKTSDMDMHVMNKLSLIRLLDNKEDKCLEVM